MVEPLLEKPTLSAQELRDKLEDRKLKVVAERTGLTYAALRRIVLGGNPSKRTMVKLERYLEN